MKTLIIQTSPKGTASTVLVNILYGLIPETAEKEVLYYDSVSDFNNIKFNTDENIKIIKTHVNNIDKLTLIFNNYNNNTNNNYNIVFICSERAQINQLIDIKYKSYLNVIVFAFDELNETLDNSVNGIVENVYNKIHDILNIPLNIQSGINRLNAMNKKYEEIKNKPFNESDPFYLIHGSHKNRKY